MSNRRKIFAVAGTLLVGLSLAVWLVERHPEQSSVVSATETEYRPGGDIYPNPVEAPADLSNALAQAAREHKHVLIDFGGNWCPDCRVLDIYFHSPSNLALPDANYTIVDVNIGNYDQNQNLADRYNVPLTKGVPALAVLDSSGKPLYVQRDGQFEAMGKMDPSSVTEFLNRWKP
jgi:thioredoxin 1